MKELPNEKRIWHDPWSSFNTLAQTNGSRAHNEMQQYFISEISVIDMHEIQSELRY